MERFGLNTEFQALCIEYFMSSYITCPASIGALFKDLEQQFKLPGGIGLNIYKHLAYKKIIDIDISKPINLAAHSESVVLVV